MTVLNWFYKTIEKEKTFGNWYDVGNCTLKDGVAGCGIDKGWQEQHRNCTDGTLGNDCTTSDRKQRIDCDVECKTSISNTALIIESNYIHDI